MTFTIPEAVPDTQFTAAWVPKVISLTDMGPGFNPHSFDGWARLTVEAVNRFGESARVETLSPDGRRAVIVTDREPIPFPDPIRIENHNPAAGVYKTADILAAAATAPQRYDGRVLVDWTPTSITMARPVPPVLALRQRFAELLGIDTFNVKLHIRWAVITGDNGGRYARVDTVQAILGKTLGTDPTRRLTLLRGLLNEIPGATSRWKISESIDGVITFGYFDDPLSGVLRYPWTASVDYTSIPFGVTSDGDPFSLGLLETNLLMGGQPGSGKSGGLTCYLAGVSRLPNVALIGLDPKRVEQAGWRPRFSRVVVTPEDAMTVLEALSEEMDRRYEFLMQQGKKKVHPTDLSADMPLIVAVIDELADLVSIGRDVELEKNIAVTIRRIIAVGRASGIIIVTATQKPSGDVVPTTLRDQIQMRVAYKTATPDVTDTILGKGSAAAGALAHEITGREKGVAYVQSDEDSGARRIRTYWIPDEEVTAIAEGTAHLRVELPWLDDALDGHRGSFSRPTQPRRPAARDTSEDHEVVVGQIDFGLDLLNEVAAQVNTPKPSDSYDIPEL